MITASRAADRTAVLPGPTSAESAESAESAQHPRRAPRDAQFDNAKLLALVLVVCGHFWEPLVGQSGNRALHSAYLLVYSFHMPVFVFISGYFSRSFTGEARQLGRLVSGVLVPYLLWSALLGVFTSGLSAQRPALDLLTPTWVTWFLLSLFCWRLSAPLWHQVRAPITTAVAVSLIAGALPLTPELSVGRTLQFLPFFVAGLTLPGRRIEGLRRSRPLRRAALPLFAGAAVAAYAVAPQMQLGWFYRSESAHGLHTGYWQWAGTSLAINAVGALLGAAFLALSPRRRCRATSLGAAGMSGYLLHPFLQRALLHEGLYRRPLLATAAGQLLLTAGAIALAVLLCTPPVARALRPLLSPRLRWLLR